MKDFSEDYLKGYNNGFNTGAETNEINMGNVHLFAEWLSKYDMEVAIALLNELEVQVGFGREADHKDQQYLNLK